MALVSKSVAVKGPGGTHFIHLGFYYRECAAVSFKLYFFQNSISFQLGWTGWE